MPVLGFAAGFVAGILLGVIWVLYSIRPELDE